jgi:hypothetical protein
MDFINELQPYILNDDNMSTYLKYKFKNNITNESKIQVKQNHKLQNNNDSKNNKLFIPSEYDTLFWCYYIIKNGDIKYELLNNKNKLAEKQLKIEYIQFIRENKQILKTYKFDTISNIENNLVNDDNINIKTIMSLCAIDKINLIFLNNNTYFELLMNDTDNIYIIHEIKTKNNYNRKYGFELVNIADLNEIRNKFYKIESLNKPIKSLASYKHQDLINISNRLAIKTINEETGKNKSKNDLYESIIQYFKL